MDLDPADLLLFARLADTGSFTRTAERVGLPKSTVSRRISALERRLGERLVLRTTRKLSLTDFGQHLLLHARQIADEVDAVNALALNRQAQPSGRLKVSLPSDPPLTDLPGLVSEFLMRYPQVVLDLDLSSRRVDLIGEGFDLALRMGDMPDDATLVARRVQRNEWALYAAPSYLALHGMPRAPDDLAQHHGLALRSRSGEFFGWKLQRGEERWEGTPPLRAMMNSPHLLAALAVRGVGIAPLPDHIAVPMAQEGQLQVVLPEWTLPPGLGWAVVPGRRLLPEKTRVFLEMLEGALARCPKAP